MKHGTVWILGVPIDMVTEEDVLQFVSQRVIDRVPSQIATINAEYVMHAQRSIQFMSVLEGAALRTADGMGVVWAARRRGGSIKRRVGGSDLIWSIAGQAERQGHRLYLLGAADGVADRAAATLKERYSGLSIVGAYSGSPRAGEDAEQIRRIDEGAVDVLLVAFGSPQQDLWIARTMPQLNVPVSIGVGGSFDYLAGTAKRAPRWMQDNGLDWLWRLVRQPSRWRRMLVLPRFALRAFIRSD